MKIAIMSDSHDNWQRLADSVTKANDAECKYLLFAGDLVSPPGLAELEKFQGDVKFVWGNNEMERVGMTRKMDASKIIELYGDYFEGEIAGVKIFMNHFPKFVELAAKSGEYDLVIHGHTHDYRVEQIDKTILVNPGEIHGYKTGKATFIIFDTSSKSVKKIIV